MLITNLIFAIYVVLTIVLGVYQTRQLKSQTELIKSQISAQKQYDRLCDEYDKLRHNYVEVLKAFDEERKRNGVGLKGDVVSTQKDNKPKRPRRKPVRNESTKKEI